MKKIIVSSVICCLSSMAFAAETIHWGYDKEISPEHWGELSENYKACSSGKNQTPINIKNIYTSNVKHKIDIHYKVSPDNIVFNGHTMQVNTKDDSDYLVLDDQKYFLKQFHFHTPSENQIKDKSYPMELHFVNANAEGQLTVLAVMFDIGKSNSEWDKMWTVLSKAENDAKPLAQPLILDKFLPNKREYYRFSGSLTTPPCTEGVNWIVMRQHLMISSTQLDEFKVLLNKQGNNRPLQPINGRVVIQD